MWTSLVSTCCLVVYTLSQGSHAEQSDEYSRMEGDDVYNIIKHRCCPSDACYPTQMYIAELNSKLEGRVILPYMNEYANRSHMYNTLEQRFPSMIVMVKSKEDIREAILFARKLNLHVTIFSSGHDFSGRSTWQSSFQINLSEMDEMSVDLSTERNPHGFLKTETGQTWAEIYKMLETYNRVVVGGSAHTVTPGGYTLGGGHSPVSRSLGYAVDNLLEVQIVLSDGRIATCTEERTIIEHIDGNIQYVENGELFWALRGGGGGTFGVVVYYIFRIHPMPEQMVVMSSFIPLSIPSLDADLTIPAFGTLFNVLATLPNEWGGYWLLNNYPGFVSAADSGLGFDLHYKGMLTLHFNKFGPWDGTETTVFKDLLSFGSKNQIPVTFSNKTSFWDYEKDAADPPVVRVSLANTLLQMDMVNENFTNFIHQTFMVDGKDQYLSCTGTLLGGKTTEAPLESTPLNPGYRTSITSLTCGVALGDTNDPLLQQTAYNDHLIMMFDEFGMELRKYGRGMYLNEPMKSNPHWKEDFWGHNYDRLLQIKNHYDSDNFFTCHHCVGSDLANDNGSPDPPVASASAGPLFSSVLVLLLCLTL